MSPLVLIKIKKFTTIAVTQLTLGGKRGVLINLFVSDQPYRICNDV